VPRSSSAPPSARASSPAACSGLCGVVFIFWTEITRATGGERAALGAVLTVAAVLLSAVGSLVASRNRRRGVALMPAMGFGMLYGALAAGVVAVVSGGSFALPTAPSWWLSFAYLAFAGSVLTFACFLTLQDRVGVGAAGTVGVMTPLLALLVSIALRGLPPDRAHRRRRGARRRRQRAHADSGADRTRAVRRHGGVVDPARTASIERAPNTTR
jgi:drug/metabolite transporter (DMT)-like permease